MPTSADAAIEEYPTFPTRAPLETQEDGVDFDSSNVHSMLYDFGDRELILRFYRDGTDALYQYEDFPAHEWQGLAEAPSKGRYINLEIRERYSFTKLRISNFPQNGRGVAHPVARRFLTAPLRSTS